jgi:hypothetical protein
VKFHAFYGTRRLIVHKSPSLHPILSQMNPIYILTPHFVKIQFIVIFPSTSTSSKWFVPFTFYKQTLVFVCCFHVRSVLYRQDPNNVLWRLDITKLLIMQLSLCSCYFPPPHSLIFLAPSIILITIIKQAHSCPFLWMRGHVSHPYTTIGNVSVFSSCLQIEERKTKPLNWIKGNISRI